MIHTVDSSKLKLCEGERGRESERETERGRESLHLCASEGLIRLDLDQNKHITTNISKIEDPFTNLSF